MTTLAPLTDDERTLLLIAANPASPPLITIGRWKKPLLSLKARGFMAPMRDRHGNEVNDVEGFEDDFNLVITPAGRAAIEADEAESDRALAKALGALR